MSSVRQGALSLRIGTAGWSIPRQHAAGFSNEGTGLARYAGRLGAAEINTSFYRPHRPATYGRWAATVPDAFRFAVKLPKAITHERRLVEAAAPLDRFLGEVAELGPKLGPLLVQLPPSLAFDPAVAGPFLRLLRDRTNGPVALEPRHAGWFGPEADALLAEHRVARVAADPARMPEAAEPAGPAGLPSPGGWGGLRYWRLHGSPVMYRSAYGPDILDALAARLAASDAETWCIFDNTASGAALGDALALLGRIGGPGGPGR